LGIDCHFSHVHEPTTRCESGVCRYYSLGQCTRGADCAYEHQDNVNTTKWKRNPPNESRNKHQGFQYENSNKSVPKRGERGYRPTGMYNRFTYPLGSKPASPNTTDASGAPSSTATGTAWPASGSTAANNKEEMSLSENESIPDDQDVFGIDLGSNNPPYFKEDWPSGQYTDRSNIHQEASDKNNNEDHQKNQHSDQPADEFSPAGISTGMMIVTSPPTEPPGASEQFCINNEAQYQGYNTRIPVDDYNNPSIVPNSWYSNRRGTANLRTQLESMTKEDLVNLVIETKGELQRHKEQIMKQKRILTRKMIPELVEALEPMIPLDDLLCEEYIPCASNPNGVMKMDDFWAAYGFDGVAERKPAYQVFNTKF